MDKIAIRGGGVAGSYLANLLQNSNYDVTLFDLKGRYFKPCGDVVPNIYEPRISWNVKYKIRNFAFYLDGEKIYDVRYRHTKWNVIDKSAWINSMLDNIKQKIIGNEKPERENYDTIINAMGPYIMDRKVVYTTRSLVKTEEFNDEAILEFNSKFTGFYWIFPDSEGIYNIGAGFLEYKNSKELLMQYIRSKLRNYEIVDTRGAPITIDQISDRNWRIGEARGLVFPMSGEGIRPSAISAEIAFDALTREKDFNETLDYRLHKLEKRIKIQHLLLRIYINLNESLRKSMLKAFLKNGVLIDAFLEDKIDFEGIAESVKAIKNGSISN